jgi:MFS family permease
MAEDLERAGSRRPALGVFLILWASYGYFWHARDWNTASRLMLTYSLVDRGTVRIDGLEDQTGDRASFGGHSYSDKLPGYSFVAAVPYGVLKALMGWPEHPRDVPAIARWPADYAATLFTSGLATALCGALLTGLAMDLGCGPRRATLIGLAYGLATPAYAYATLAHGHQLSAACLLGAFALLWRRVGSAHRSTAPDRWAEPTLRDAEVPADVTWASPIPPFAFAGLLAAFASTVELQVAPVSAILGLYAIALSLHHKQPWRPILAFALGALFPTLFLLAYNTTAFGSPWRMGYFFHATERFARVHSAANPLGLRPPDWSRLDDLTIKPARGVFWYAPIVLLTIPGLIVLMVRRFFGMAVVCTGAIAAVLLVNLSYPEWSGGWSTGPRLLVPMLPFAMLPVARLLAVGGRATIALAAILALVGAVVIFLFQGVGARVPNPIDAVPPGYVDPLAEPLTRAVLPLWRGEPLPGWAFGNRFSRNLATMARPEAIKALPASWQWVQFAPLVVFQALAIGVLFRSLGPRSEPPA